MILKVLKMLAQGASQHGDLPLSVFKCSFWCSKTEISNMPFLITKVLHDRTSSKNKVNSRGPLSLPCFLQVLGRTSKVLTSGDTGRDGHC